MKVLDLVLGTVNLIIIGLPVFLSFNPCMMEFTILLVSFLGSCFSGNSDFVFISLSFLFGSLLEHVIDVSLHVVHGFFDGPEILLGCFEFG